MLGQGGRAPVRSPIPFMLDCPARRYTLTFFLTSPGFPLIAYGNIGYADEAQGWINTDAVDPDSYLQVAQTWTAQIVGGCCGTTPEHIRKLRVGWGGTA